MSPDPNAVKEDPGVIGFDPGADLKKLEAFGIAFGELELTGIGNAHLELPLPTVQEKGTVNLGRALAYNVQVQNGKLVVDVKAA